MAAHRDVLGQATCVAGDNHRSHFLPPPVLPDSATGPLAEGIHSGIFRRPFAQDNDGARRGEHPRHTEDLRHRPGHQPGTGRRATEHEHDGSHAPLQRPPGPPASGESAARPVIVRVRTVVVKSGTPSLRTTAFRMPMARPVRPIRRSRSCSW